MVSFKSINLDQISSANNINFVRIYKNKYENIAYKNYNNSQISTDVNTIGPKIWDSTSFKGWVHYIFASLVLGLDESTF